MEPISICSSTCSFNLNTFIFNSTWNQCGLSGSPTKVKTVQNIVFQAKESKTLSASDADVESLIKELLDEKIIG